MKITDIRNKFIEYKISYMQKKDFVIGITANKIGTRRQDIYENVYIASKDKKFYLLYVVDDFTGFTGSFKSKKEAVSWFKNGGR